MMQDARFMPFEADEKGAFPTWFEIKTEEDAKQQKWKLILEEHKKVVYRAPNFLPENRKWDGSTWTTMLVAYFDMDTTQPNRVESFLGFANVLQPMMAAPKDAWIVKSVKIYPVWGRLLRSKTNRKKQIRKYYTGTFSPTLHLHGLGMSFDADETTELPEIGYFLRGNLQLEKQGQGCKRKRNEEEMNANKKQKK